MPEGPFGVGRFTSLGPFVSTEEEKCNLSNEAEEFFKRIFEEIYIKPLKRAVEESPGLLEEDGELGFVDDPAEGEELRVKTDDMVNDAISEAEKSGVEFIGMGMNRAVFTKTNFVGVRECVVKVPFFALVRLEPEDYFDIDTAVYEPNAGIQDSITEYDNWKALGGAEPPLFLPILDIDSSFRWSVSPYVETDPSVFGDVRDRLEQNQLVVRDLSPDNVGLYNSHPVVIDYGGMIEDYGEPIMTFDEIQERRREVMKELIETYRIK